MELTQLIMMNYERDCCTVRPYPNWHNDMGEQKKRFVRGCFIWDLVEAGRKLYLSGRKIITLNDNHVYLCHKENVEIHIHSC